MKKMKKYLKAGILLLGILLLLWNCQQEEFSDITKQETSNIKLKTVSLEDAKNFFQAYQKNQPKAKGSKRKNLIVTPNWNTKKHKSLFYTSAMLTTVDVSINRKGKFTTEILFIEVNGKIRSVIYTLYVDAKNSKGKLKNARVYLTELNGDYIDGYGFENGLITSRFLPKKESNTVSNKNIAAKYEYPTTFWGEGDSTESGGEGDNPDGGGGCSDCIQLEEVVVVGYLKSPYHDSNGNFINPINDYTYKNEDDNLNEFNSSGGSISTSTIQEVTTAVVIDPVIKCDPGYMLINGDCVIDTESPCPLEGYIRDESGKCVLAPDQIINNLKEKADCVYQKLINNSLLSKTLDKFNGEKTPVHLILEEEDIPGNASGETDYGDSFYITIKLDSEHIKSRPALFGALVILHEAIHAEIYRKIKTTSGIHYTLSGEWVLGSGAKAHFGTLFDYYNDYPENPQHNYMADYYREAMETGLKEFAKSIGKTYSDQLISDLVWIGLHNTNAWDNMYADPVYTKNEQERMKKVFDEFIKSEQNDCK